MSTPQGRKNIIRLRTFADDAERAREATGATEHVDAEIAPEDMLPEDKSVFHKVKKKDLNLKDDEATPSAIDAEGVSFDKKTATHVVDQVYEEGREVKKNTAELKATEVPKNVAASVIEKAPTPPKPPATKKPVPKPPVVQSDDIAEASEHFEDTIEESDTSSEGLSQGEFVRDTKRNRFKLIPAIGEAMTGWFIDTKEQIEEVGREKHTVSKTENRVETIKKAALPETFAPDADFDQVADRLKKVKRQHVDTPVVIKPKEKGAQAQWSHLTSEEGDETVEREVPTPATPQSIAKVEAPTPEVESIQLTETKTEQPIASAPEETQPTISPQPTQTPAQPTVTETTPTTEPAAAEPVERTQSVVTPMTDEYLSQQPAPAAQEVTPVEAIPQTPEVAPEAQPEPVQIIAPEPSSTSPITPTQTTTPPETSSTLTTSQVATPKQMREYLPSPILAIVVVVFAIIAGVGTSLYFFWQPPQGAVTVAEQQATTKPLFTAQLQTSIPYSNSHTDTMSTMLAAINSDPSTLYLYLVDPETEAPLTPREVMTHMAPQAPGAFARSVSNISFGALNNRPFIIIQTNNFDAAFSGMIAWEQTMSADLAPLFGPVVTETYDPQARTDAQTRSAYFKDVVSNNLSSRLLSDEVGKDRIMYTFVNKQTIIIATDRLQINDIIPLIR